MTQFPECPGTSKWKKWTLGLNIQSGKHQEELTLTVLATEEAVQRTVGGETMYLVQSPGVNADKMEGTRKETYDIVRQWYLRDEV